MDPESSEPAPTFHEPPRYHSFWPIFLLGLSLLFIFSWEIQVAIATRASAQHLQEQQSKLVDEATRVQGGLEKIVRGLANLAKTDEAAQKLVTKFGIKVNKPAVPTSTPAP